MNDPVESLEARYARYSRVFRGRGRPFAYVDLDLFDRNAHALRARAGKLPIRVASKSVRSVALLKRVLAIPGYAGVLAYRASEAVFLASQGIRDIVVAYPATEEAELAETAAALKKGAEITLMVDRPEHLKILAAAANAHAVVFPIAFDLDLSVRLPGLHFGVHRSWLNDVDRVRAMLSALADLPLLTLDGVMGYEAQIAGVDDLSAPARFLKRWTWSRVAARRSSLVSAIRAAGFSPRFVNGGGTGSFERTRTDDSVTELAAGSGLFSPTLFDGYRAFRGEPAAGFALAVTRKPERGIATCFGGGYVASGAAGKAKLPTPFLPPDLELFPHEGAGEVQTPVGGHGAAALKIGDSVFFRHAKAGELCERFDSIHLVQGERVAETVLTYRGEGRNFG
ncbi:MAG: alanine racemase [Bdellovibrionales bacterium]|nr:alanine racemase [Bdellovibrionales bacterium]